MKKNAIKINKEYEYKRQCDEMGVQMLKALEILLVHRVSVLLLFWFVFVVEFYKFVIRQTGKLKTPTNPTTMPVRETVPWQYKHNQRICTNMLWLANITNLTNIYFSLNSKMRLPVLYKSHVVEYIIDLNVTFLWWLAIGLRLGMGIQGRICTIYCARSIT